MFISLFVASFFLFLGSNFLFFVYREKKKVSLFRIIIQNIILFVSAFITLYSFYKISDLIAMSGQINDILIMFAVVIFFNLLVIATAGKQKLSIKRFLILLAYTIILYVAMYIQQMIIKH